MFRPAEKYTQICEFFMIFSISLHNLIISSIAANIVRKIVKYNEFNK